MLWAGAAGGTLESEPSLLSVFEMQILTIVPSALQSCFCVPEPFGFESTQAGFRGLQVWVEQGDICAGAVGAELPTPSWPGGQEQAQICA